MAKTSSIKEIFDALSDADSGEGCDPDWCREVLLNADPQDVAKVKEAFSKGGTESEIAYRLGVLD